MGRVMGSHMLHSKAAQEPERFDALEKAGFKLDRRGDMTYYLLEKLGGHYMDVGTSAKIASGLVSLTWFPSRYHPRPNTPCAACSIGQTDEAPIQIKVKSDSLPVRYTEDGLECEDGSHLPADVVVFATGFVGNLRVIVKMLFGDEVGDQVEDYWGLDEEGELRGAFKPCGREFPSAFDCQDCQLTLSRSWFLVFRRSCWPSEIFLSLHRPSNQSDVAWNAPPDL